MKANAANARKDPNSGMSLFFGEHQSICPFVPAIPMQGSMGQVQLVRMPCVSSCPLAQVTDTQWVCKCGGETVTHELEELIPLAEEVINPDSKIIQLGSGL